MPQTLPPILPHRQGIEDAIVNRRREEYEEKVKGNGYDYDSWFDYIRLEETEGLDHDKTRGWTDNMDLLLIHI